MVVANLSQRRQQKLSEHERELGAIEAVQGPEAGPWRDEPLGVTLSCRRRRGEECEVFMRDKRLYVNDTVV